MMLPSIVYELWMETVFLDFQANSDGYLLTMKIIMILIKVSPIGLIEGLFWYFIFLLESQTGETLSYAEMLPKTISIHNSRTIEGTIVVHMSKKIPWC